MELETTAVQASLLLRCGDVESNPGPLTREGNKSNSLARYTCIKNCSLSYYIYIDIQKVDNSKSLSEYFHPLSSTCN